TLDHQFFLAHTANVAAYAGMRKPGLVPSVGGNGRMLSVRSPRRLQIFRARDKENGQDDIEGDDAHEQPFEHSTLVASEAVQVRGMQRHKYLPARELRCLSKLKWKGNCSV